MDQGHIRSIDITDRQDGTPLEADGDAEDYRRRGVDVVKDSLGGALRRLEIADEWAPSVGDIPEPLRQRIKELHVECRRAVKEAEEVL